MNSTFYADLYRFYEKMEEILANCFGRHIYFTSSFRMAYTQLLNRPIGVLSVAELMAT